MKRLSDFFKEATLHTFSDYLSLGRRIEQKIIVSELSVESTLNVALLTSSTVNGVKEVLVTQCSFFDVYVNVYVGEYGQYAQEILNPDSDLYASKPDLIIRTSGEQRLSGYLLWTGAYSEYYFANCHWPDFNEEELDKAIDSYMSRERRFGGDSKKSS